MQTITLAEPWTYRTPLVTIKYPAGEHVVANAIAESAIAATASRDAAPPGPLDQSIEALGAYLADVDDLAEIVSLIEAEEAGKTRIGELAALNARKAELEA